MPDHPYVTEEMKGQFWHDGVVLLPQVLEPTWMDLVELGVKRNLANPGPYFQHHYAGTPRQFIDDYCNYAAIPEYRMLVEHSPVAAVVASVLRSERLWLFLRADLHQGRRRGRGPADAMAPGHHLLDHRWQSGRRVLDHSRRHPGRGLAGVRARLAPGAHLCRHRLRLPRRDHSVHAGRRVSPHPRHRGRPGRLRHRVVPNEAR